jgi:hypothetical protein
VSICSVIEEKKDGRHVQSTSTYFPFGGEESLRQWEVSGLRVFAAARREELLHVQRKPQDNVSSRSHYRTARRSDAFWDSVLVELLIDESGDAMSISPTRGLVFPDTVTFCAFCASLRQCIKETRWPQEGAKGTKDGKRSGLEATSLDRCPTRPSLVEHCIMKLDRTQLTITDLHGEAEATDRDYWRSKSPAERLRAVQTCREIAYGRANATARLQRVLEIAERR